jgi:DNA polymerase-3 subunit alpha
MAFVTLDDGTAQREVAVFSSLYDQSRQLIKENQLLVVEGRVTVEAEKGLRLAANQVFDWKSAQRQLACRLVLKLDTGVDTGQLLNLLHPHTGGACTVQLSFASTQAQCDLVLGNEWRVSISDQLLKELAGCLQESNIRLSFKAEGAAAVNPFQA